MLNEQSQSSYRLIPHLLSEAFPIDKRFGVGVFGKVLLVLFGGCTEIFQRRSLGVAFAHGFAVGVVDGKADPRCRWRFAAIREEMHVKLQLRLIFGIGVPDAGTEFFANRLALSVGTVWCHDGEQDIHQHGEIHFFRIVLDFDAMHLIVVTFSPYIAGPRGHDTGQAREYRLQFVEIAA